jgi:acyl carrier protein
LDIRLENVIRRVFSLEEGPIDENWTSENIPDWDSVGHLNLIVDVEKEFNIKIEIEEMFEIEKLSDISRILEKKGF